MNSVKLGQTSAAINSAYYDGTSLIVGYAIRNGSYMEECIPDETLAAEMTQMDNNLVWVADNDEESELIMACMVGSAARASVISLHSSMEEMPYSLSTARI